MSPSRAPHSTDLALAAAAARGERPAASHRPSSRLTSIDAMRGLAVAAMILVNNPGSWTESYPFLSHAAWNGWTLADVVFPSFLLVVGVSIDMSLSRRGAIEHARGGVLAHVAQRALLLFALGLLLNAVPDASLATLRLFGVLQRIAICYFVGATLFLTTGARGHVVTAVALLAAYWAVMFLVPVPGVGAGVLAPEGNLVGWIDDQLFRGHLYHPGFDPEGLLSTCPAVATTLIGMLAGRWLRSRASAGQKTLRLLLGGAALAVAGELADRWFPINKQLWTSSFVLLTGGLGLMLLAACYELLDRRACKALGAPFVILGTNALAIYLLSSLGSRLMEVCQIHAGATCESLRLFLYEHLFESWAGALRGSLLFALAYLLACMMAATELYRRRVFLRL